MQIAMSLCPLRRALIDTQLLSMPRLLDTQLMCVTQHGCNTTASTSCWGRLPCWRRAGVPLAGCLADLWYFGSGGARAGPPRMSGTTPQKLSFSVAACSSEDAERYPSSELAQHHGPETRGWQSAPFCEYPVVRAGLMLRHGRFAAACRGFVVEAAPHSALLFFQPPPRS